MSNFLELAAVDDLTSFISEVETKGIGLDETGFWYGRLNSSNGKFRFEERTPLMIASVYGSIRVQKYLIAKKVDVNKTSGTDGAAALHCAAAGGSVTSIETVKILLDAGADGGLRDGAGNRAGDLIPRGIKSYSAMRKGLEMVLNGFVTETAKKEFPVDLSLPDINNPVYGSDEFRMYTFKVKPCSRAYTHDWTECPFVHPGENARRRDPKKYSYTCVPCPEFRKGSCGNGDACEYAHGVFESWLHPAQYKTRLCKDETGCARKVCFFAHRAEELRPVYAYTGSAIPSPKFPHGNSGEFGSNKSNQLNARDLELESLLAQHKQRHQMIDDLSANLYGSSGSYKSSPVRKPAGFGSSAAVAQAVINSRSAGAFSKQRSQSFIDRGTGGAVSGVMSPKFSQWGSPEGKPEWGFNGDDANKFRKSASFAFRNGVPVVRNEPDVSWVNTLVKDVSSVGIGLYSSSEKRRYGGVGGGETLPPWVEQIIREQERLVA